MKHTHNPDNNEPVMAFDERISGTSVPTEDIAEIRAIGLGNALPENAPRTANQPEHLAERPIGVVGDPLALVPAPVRRRRAPRRSRNHALIGLLMECRKEPYADSIIMTRSAFETGLRCTRWRNMELLYDALPVLADVADQVAGSDDVENAEHIELAMRRHENCPTIMFWGDKIALPHRHDVHDTALDVSLRIHFATDAESCRVIVGWIEEIHPNENPAETESQRADAGRNALVCA